MTDRWMLPISQIIIPEHRLRDVVEDMCWTLSEHGQLVPILVYCITEDGQQKFVLKDGLQRLKAAEQLNWKYVWCTLADPFENVEQSLLEQYALNNTRSNVSYLDQARLWQTLLDMKTWTQADISTYFRVSTATVSLAISVLKADPTIQELVASGRLSASAVRALLPLSHEKQRKLAPAAAVARTTRAVYDLVRTDQVLDNIQTVEEDPDFINVPEDAEQDIAPYLLQEALDILKDLPDDCLQNNPALQSLMESILKRVQQFWEHAYV